MKQKCEHQWKEGEMIACGGLFLISGDRRIVCQKCNDVRYFKMKDTDFVEMTWKRGYDKNETNRI